MIDGFDHLPPEIWNKIISYYFEDNDPFLSPLNLQLVSKKFNTEVIEAVRDKCLCAARLTFEFDNQIKELFASNSHFDESQKGILSNKYSNRSFFGRRLNNEEIEKYKTDIKNAKKKIQIL